MFKKKHVCHIEGINDMERYGHEKNDYKMFSAYIGHYLYNDMEYLNFYINLFVNEIRYSSLLEMVKGDGHGRYNYPFRGTMCAELLGYKADEDRTQTIDVRENNLIAAPWEYERQRPLITRMKTEAFPYDEEQVYSAIYYDGLNVTCGYNGCHGLGMVSYLGRGRIEAEYYDVRKIFKYVDTNEDLSFSYNQSAILERMKKSGEELTPELKKKLGERFYGTDYKLILLYDLCKRKWKWETQYNGGELTDIRDIVWYFMALDKNGYLFSKSKCGEVRLNAMLNLVQKIHIAEQGTKMFSNDIYASGSKKVSPEVHRAYLTGLNGVQPCIKDETAKFLNRIYTKFQNATLDELIVSWRSVE